MIESPLLLTFFEVLNLLVAAFIGGYVFYVYGLEPLKKEVQDRIQALKDLKQHAYDLHQQQKHVEKLIADEHEYGHELLKKIETWNEVVEQKEVVAQQDVAHRKNEILVRTKKQEAVLYEKAFNHQVADKVYEKVSNQANTLYRDPKQAELFLSRIINQLKSE